MHIELSEQEIFRRKSLEELEQLGINPYPAATYEVTVNSQEILDKFPADNTLYQNVSIAGRIMNRRFIERRLREEFGFAGAPVEVSVRVRT
jgi:lysyl-tRNA synthetase class 2